MITGRIIRFDESRGYGFIAPDRGGEDVFVHAKDLDVDGGQVTCGTRVSFDLVEGERGLKAFGVRVLHEEGATRAPLPESAPVTRPVESDQDDVCEVLSLDEFNREVTELLMRTVPEATGGQLLKTRAALAEWARARGWVE